MGYNFADTATNVFRPNLDDVELEVRLGWMLNSPAGSGFFRGNLEFLVEASAADVTRGRHGVLVGGAVLARYNFVQDTSSWTPYVQLGLGAVYKDIYRNRLQRLIGQPFEFSLQAGAGGRYRLISHNSLNVEGGYRHISNANLANRNYGLNSLGMQAGVSWYW